MMTVTDEQVQAALIKYHGYEADGLSDSEAMRAALETYERTRATDPMVAASPDMYEALADVVSEYDSMGNGRTLRWAIDSAREVLAKARGERHG